MHFGRWMSVGRRMAVVFLLSTLRLRAEEERRWKIISKACKALNKQKGRR